MKKILVVDDTYISLTTAERILGKKYSVLTANSGANCILLLKNEQVDLILLDMEMPSMNGIETLAKIRSLPGGENIPVMMVTGDDTKESVIAMAKLSIVDYLTKPYMPDELLRRVERVFS